MSPVRRIFSPLVALLASACAEESSTAVALAGLDEPLDLQLSIPRLSPDMFVTREPMGLGALDVPALLDGEEPPETEFSDQPLAESAIWNAVTSVWFWPQRVEVVGEHDYIGNMSRVDITGSVWHDGLPIGSQSGSNQESHFFLNPFAHHMIGHVLINLDSDCGLDADGTTKHSVWWEFAPGTGAASFDKTELPSYATRESQPPCEPVVDYGGDSGGGGGGGGISDEWADYTCWIWFTYDEATLEVLDIQAMWCSGGG